MNHNNTTLDICDNDFTYDRFVLVSKIIWHTSGFICFIIGIPGHIFHIIILSNKTNRKEFTSLYFITISICELIFLIGALWLWTASMSLIKYDPREVLSCGIFHCIILGSTTLSNLYLASIAIDRSIMILCPMSYRSIVTRPRVIFRLILICLIVILLLVPNYFYLHYNAKATLFLCDFSSSNNRQRIHLLSLMHALFFVSIPSLIVCISSIILLNNRCQHKHIYKKTLSLSARRMHKRSILTFLVSLWFFFSLLPAFVVEIFVLCDQYFYRDMHCLLRMKIYKILLNCFLILLAMNYSTKFYIHLIISTSFRDDFIQFISCQNNQNSLESRRMNNKNNNELRLLPLLNQNPTKATEI
ncbi:unnamed protein product [Rotaria sp. Silwood2]|nr:unnamed protein product [Rotaria sp. Silwood2]CAF4353320.1 unnamed protein product [Rotaria sp. Silwood2]